MITIEQMKAARVMLNLKQVELAHLAGISLATLNNIERGAQTDPKASTLKAIQQALEKRGIAFVSNSLHGVGVHLRPTPKPASEALILIVDDNKSDRMLYKTWLQRETNNNYRLYEADNAKAGFDVCMEHAPGCIILDFMMRGADGFQLLSALKREQMKLPPVILVSGQHTPALHEAAHSQGVYACLSKQTLHKADLCATVANALGG